MTNLIIEDEVAAKLAQIAADEKRPVTDVIRSLLKLYSLEYESSDVIKLPVTANEALAAMDGMFDDDVTDLSTTVRETMAAYYQKKYGDSD